MNLKIQLIQYLKNKLHYIYIPVHKCESVIITLSPIIQLFPIIVRFIIEFAPIIVPLPITTLSDIFADLYI